VNTGFETPNPQILLPAKAEKKLGLWSDLLRGTAPEIYDTAGGPTKARNAVEVRLAERAEAVADAVISPRGRGPHRRQTGMCS